MATTLHEGKFLSLCCDNNGYEFAHTINGTGVVEIVACFQDDSETDLRRKTKIILIEQFRPVIGRQMISLPAGHCGDHDDPNESLESAAQRELLEETGYQSESMIFLSQGPASAGKLDEILSFFLAHNIQKINNGGGTERENIIVHEVPLVFVNSWLSNKTHEGIMICPRVWAGIYLRIAYLTGQPIEKIQ